MHVKGIYFSYESCGVAADASCILHTCVNVFVVVHSCICMLAIGRIWACCSSVLGVEICFGLGSSHASVQGLTIHYVPAVVMESGSGKLDKIRC